MANGAPGAKKKKKGAAGFVRSVRRPAAESDVEFSSAASVGPDARSRSGPGSNTDSEDGEGLAKHIKIIRQLAPGPRSSPTTDASTV